MAKSAPTLSFFPLPLADEIDAAGWPELRLVMLAGEPSGDNIGGAILAELAALQEANKTRILVGGTGGPAMERQGLISFSALKNFNFMGWLPVVLNLPGILNSINAVQAAVLSAVHESGVDAVIGIDAQGYVSRVFRALPPGLAQRVQVVAPTVWARSPERAVKYAKFLDLLLCIYPFEPAYFSKHGLEAAFVGHPLVTGGPAMTVKGGFYAHHSLSDHSQVVAILPGSRPSEVKTMLPIFVKTFRELQANCSQNLVPAIPVPPQVADLVRAMCAKFLPEAIIVEGGQGKASLFADAEVALCCAGTAVIELALAGTPTVVGYSQDPLSNFVWSRVWRSDASIVNILAGSRVQPEFVLGECTPSNLCQAARKLLSDKSSRQALAAQQSEHILAMGVEGENGELLSPAALAAQQIWRALERN